LEARFKKKTIFLPYFVINIKVFIILIQKVQDNLFLVSVEEFHFRLDMVTDALSSLSPPLPPPRRANNKFIYITLHSQLKQSITGTIHTRTGFLPSDVKGTVPHGPCQIA
jgi:hypothetical protein